MKKALFFLVITMLHAGVFAQGQGGGSVAVGASKPIAGSKITGTVLDAETQQPVEFATVALAAVGTEKPLDGTVCDDKGKFTISKVNPGTYDVIVSFIGYE